MTQQVQTTANKLTKTTKSPMQLFLEKPKVLGKVEELVGKNSVSFCTSLLQIVNSNSLLSKAEPMSILNAACMAATLNLPINNTLGFAYIVPYNNKKKIEGQDVWVTEAQFQLGYKGFIQLAQRTGQFKRLVSVPVYESQLISKNPITGYQFNWDIEPGTDELPIGYYAYFELLNGFTADLYMSSKQLEEHGKRYSQTFKKGFGVWKDNFEAMALKTVMKLLLSKQAPLSIEIQRSLEADQSVVKNVTDNEFEYPDNDLIDHQSDNLIQVDDQTIDTDTGEVLQAAEDYPLNPDDAAEDDFFAGTN